MLVINEKIKRRSNDKSAPAARSGESNFGKNQRKNTTVDGIGGQARLVEPVKRGVHFVCCCF